MTVMANNPITVTMNSFIILVFVNKVQLIRNIKQQNELLGIDI